MAYIKSNNILYFLKMFKFMRPYLCVYIFGIILYSSQGFIFPYISALFMSRLIESIINLNIYGVFNASILFMILNIIAMLIISPGIYLFALSEAKALRNLKTRLFKCFVTNNIESSLSSHSAENIAAINTDGDVAANIYSNALSPFLSCIISIIMASIVVFYIDFRIGFAAIITGLISFFAQIKLAKPLGELGKIHLNMNADSLKSISNIFSGALSIRIFNMQKTMLLNFDSENKKIKSLSFKQAYLYMWQDLFTTFQGWLTLCVVFFGGGWLVIMGQLEFYVLILAPPMCMAISGGMSGIGGAWANLQPPIEASKRIFKIIDNSNIINQYKKHDENNIIWDGTYKIKINNMNFKYNNSNTNALSDIDIIINENEMVAFVGESGSGKSTLLKVIIGLFPRDETDIILGNIHFKSTDIINWRMKFAYVDQNCKLFNLSIEDNISFGALGHASEDDIRSAVKRSYSDQFIFNLPDSYNTLCGEKGTVFSGGQRQRIAIARALVRKSPILVFDEPTAALDADSEKSIMDTIKNLRIDHTILITTHNLNNIIDADKIVVMEKGRIAEIGTHIDLLNKKGIYYKLYNKIT